MEEKKKELEKARDNLRVKKQFTTIASVNSVTLDRTLKATEEIRSEAITFGKLFYDFIREFGNQLDNLDAFKQENIGVANEVVAHVDKVEARVAARKAEEAQREEAERIR